MADRAAGGGPMRGRRQAPQRRGRQRQLNEEEIVAQQVRRAEQERIDAIPNSRVRPFSPNNEARRWRPGLRHDYLVAEVRRLARGGAVAPNRNPRQPGAPNPGQREAPNPNPVARQPGAQNPGPAAAPNNDEDGQQMIELQMDGGNRNRQRRGAGQRRRQQQMRQEEEEEQGDAADPAPGPGAAPAPPAPVVAPNPAPAPAPPAPIPVQPQVQVQAPVPVAAPPAPIVAPAPPVAAPVPVAPPAPRPAPIFAPPAPQEVRAPPAPEVHRHAPVVAVPQAPQPAPVPPVVAPAPPPPAPIPAPLPIQPRPGLPQAVVAAVPDLALREQLQNAAEGGVFAQARILIHRAVEAGLIEAPIAPPAPPQAADAAPVEAAPAPNPPPAPEPPERIVRAIIDAANAARRPAQMNELRGPFFPPNDPPPVRIRALLPGMEDIVMNPPPGPDDDVPLRRGPPEEFVDDAPDDVQQINPRPRILNQEARPRRINPIAMKHLVRYQTLQHGEFPNKNLVLFRAGNLEVYMHKHKVTGMISPCKYDRCLPESTRMKLPTGMGNNFANWDADDVMRWARKFIVVQDDLDTLALYRFTGLDIYYITRRQLNNQPLYFKKLSPEATTPMMLDPPMVPVDAPQLAPRVLDALGRNINKVFNLLHGFQ